MGGLSGLEIVKGPVAKVQQPDAAPARKVVLPSAVERDVARDPVVAEWRDDHISVGVDGGHGVAPDRLHLNCVFVYQPPPPHAPKWLILWNNFISGMPTLEAINRISASGRCIGQTCSVSKLPILNRNLPKIANARAA